RAAASNPDGWLVHVDDDDWLPDYYIARVMAALKLDPDAVGYWVQLSCDGQPGEIAIHTSRMARYSDWHGPWSKTHYYLRTINHINPVRTSIAKLVPFPDRRQQNREH